jgi:catechol 2,3-dioxygenase-like lactoylglutathione lyase family enzyme
MITAMITGAHVILFTPEADALRSVFRDALGWKHVDAHDGWLIFALPPAEIAAHPSVEGDTHHQLHFMCDDLASTTDELRAKGIEIRGEPEEHDWGVATTMVLPGGVEVMLYEPRHESPIAPSVGR